MLRDHGLTKGHPPRRLLPRERRTGEVSQQRHHREHDRRDDERAVLDLRDRELREAVRVISDENFLV